MKKTDLERKWKKGWKIFATGSNSKRYRRGLVVRVPDKLNDEAGAKI
jgi:hypothetical protein